MGGLSRNKSHLDVYGNCFLFCKKTFVKRRVGCNKDLVSVFKAVVGVYYKASSCFSAECSAADLFAFPTLYEGFGIPVLEAQACGVPVVAGDCSALREVAGDGAELVDSYDTESICAGIRRVLEDEARAEKLVEKGYWNVKRFSWESSARRLKEVLEREVGP